MKQIRLLPLFVFICAFLSLAAGCASSSKNLKEIQEDLPLIGNVTANRYVLNNGLKLVVVRDTSSPTFAYYTWFDVGSRHEKIKRTGLAHLFEHMMFKGTQKHPEGVFDGLLEKAGAEGENAFTSHDYTAYVQELPVGNLELIAELESDRMVNLVVNEKSFKTETEVVQNERRFRNENNPAGLIEQEMFNTAFTRHPYHWPVIGYQEDLEAMSAKDAVSFYKSFYSPNRATIVVVGDVKPSEVLAVVEKNYGHIPAAPAPHIEYKQEPEQTSTRRKTLKLNLQVEKALIGYKIPRLDHADTPVFEVLQGMLSDGHASRLRRALVDSGIASNVSSGSYQNHDSSLFMISIDLQAGKTATQAESVVNSELEKLMKTSVKDDELKRAKNLVLASFYATLEENTGKAYFIGKFETSLGTFERGRELYERIEKVTSDQVKNVIRKYFTAKSKTVITGVPK